MDRAGGERDTFPRGLLHADQHLQDVLSGVKETEQSPKTDAHLQYGPSEYPVAKRTNNLRGVEGGHLVAIHREKRLVAARLAPPTPPTSTAASSSGCVRRPSREVPAHGKPANP